MMEDIKLNDKDRRIFDTLLQVVDHFNLDVQLYAVGGWVRDKLLGKEYSDIDICIDYMLGQEFCEKVNEFMIYIGHKKQKIHVVKKNPPQCKYVETARMKFFDEDWIDFVNLQSQDYTENSRMEFGPEEKDAYRRDLTINSLYYNIKTCSVKDFTGRGLDDLKNGMIATTLPPKEMFLDDPLRVLRAIRFSVRYEFEMVKELKVAAADKEVRIAFSNRITRERIGYEIDNMLKGTQPVKAIKCISEFGLFWNVFTLPPSHYPSISAEHEKKCVYYMDAAWRLLLAMGGCTLDDAHKRLFLYAALFLPLREIVYLTDKNKIESSVNHIFKSSLITKVGDKVIRLHNSVEKLSSVIPFVVSSIGLEHVKFDWISDIIDVPISLKLRILFGWIIRELREFWRPALLLSLVSMKSYGVESLEFEIEVFRKVEKLNLDEVWKVESLVKGNEIMGILRGGSEVAKWKKKQIQWQLAYPSGNVQEFTDWMMKQLKKPIGLA